AWMVYALARMLIGVLRVFPVNWNLRTARVFARAWWYVLPRHRRRACAHIRMACGPDLSDREVERMALRSLEALAMLAIDFIFLPLLVNERTWGRYIRLHNLRDALRSMLDGKGALLLTPHFGNWELAGYLLALFGFDVAAIMRPLDNVYLNRYVVDVRRRTGLELIDKKGAMENAEDILARGGALGFIADQNAGSKGLFVDFFGIKASTYKSIGLLAMTRDVPIIVGYALRLDNRFRFEVGVERVIHPAEWQNRDDPLRWVTQEFTNAMEASIRRAPEQYLWIHRRWKSRPKGEKPLPAIA
ncbi:MAG TPA: lysophospholipid acyltransferase family protein, partial [Phycisphaerae bacterium]|nr:lysophospholipid acyltransferase family protein [Phycisphaerae bacterium]